MSSTDSLNAAQARPSIKEWWLGTRDMPPEAAAEGKLKFGLNTWRKRTRNTALVCAVLAVTFKFLPLALIAGAFGLGYAAAKAGIAHVDSSRARQQRAEAAKIAAPAPAVPQLQPKPGVKPAAAFGAAATVKAETAVVSAPANDAAPAHRSFLQRLGLQR